jgi:hypothetical protein
MEVYNMKRMKVRVIDPGNEYHNNCFYGVHKVEFKNVNDTSKAFLLTVKNKEQFWLPIDVEIIVEVE